MTTTTTQVETYEFEAFKKITDDENRVFSVLGKTQDELRYFVSSYKAEIPPEIEAKIDYAKEHKMFAEFRVWHNPIGDMFASDRKAGPLCFLVGVVKKEHEFSGVDYLIGRWGETLPTWDEMKAMAVEAKRKEVILGLEIAQKKVALNLDAIQGESDEEIMSRTLPYICGLR